MWTVSLDLAGPRPLSIKQKQDCVHTHALDFVTNVVSRRAGEKRRHDGSGGAGDSGSARQHGRALAQSYKASGEKHQTAAVSFGRFRPNGINCAHRDSTPADGHAGVNDNKSVSKDGGASARGLHRQRHRVGKLNRQKEKKRKETKNGLSLRRQGTLTRANSS